jgi:hypothetical protein
VAFAGAALLAPLGYMVWQVVSHFEDYESLFGTHTMPPAQWGWWALLCLSIVLLPLLAAGIVYTIERSRYRAKHKAGEDGTENPPRFGELLVQGNRTVVHSSSLKTPDPTSIEFCTFFVKLMKTALGLHPNRRVILVIDNLDRIERADALALWSTMRSVFTTEGGREPEWLKQVWLLVPIDRDAAVRLWDGMEERSSDTGQQGTKKPADTPGQTESASRGHGDEFLSKTFQLRFHVPPPTLTCWQTFLSKKLHEALPDHRDDRRAADRIIKLFDLVGPGSKAQVTPRDVVLFLNRLVAVHSRWHEDIDLVTQAAYALLEPQIRSKPAGLLAYDFVRPAAVALLENDNWRLDLARVHYNVAQREQVLQVAFASDIEEALVTPDAPKLAPMAHVPGFKSVVSGIICRRADTWATEDGARLTAAATALQGLDKESDPDYYAAWTTLGAAPAMSWSKFGSPEGTGIVTIWKRNPRRAQYLAEDTLRILSASPQRSADDWATGTVEVLKYLDSPDVGLGVVAEAAFKVPTDHDFYVAVMASLAQKSTKAEIVRYYVPGNRPEEITRAFELAAGAKDKRLGDTHAAAAKMMSLVPVDWDWRPLMDAILRNLSPAAASSTPEEADACVATLFTILHAGNRNQAEVARERIESLVIQGVVAVCLYLTKTADRDEGAARCAFIMFDLHPASDYHNPRAGGHSQSLDGVNEYNALCQRPDDRKRLAEHFATLVQSHMSLATFVDRAKKASAAPLARFVLLRILAGDGTSGFFKPDEVIRDVDFLAGSLMDDFDAFTKALTSVTTLTAKVSSLPFENGKARFYAAIVRAYDRSWPSEFVAKLRSGLSAIDKLTWSRQLEQPSDLLLLVAECVSRGLQLDLGANLRDAMQEYADAVLDSRKRPNSKLLGWPALPNAIETTQRKTFLSAVARRLVGWTKKPEGLANLLLLLGEALLDTDVMRTHAQDLVSLYESNLSVMGETELTWFAKTLAPPADVLNAAADYTVASLARRVVDELPRRAADQKVAAALNAIAKSIDVHLSARTKQNNQNSG